MPRGKKTQGSTDVQAIVENFSTGLKSDLFKLYQMGFTAGAVAERQRMADLITSGNAGTVKTVSQKRSDFPKEPAVPKKARKNPWANYTPEQRAARVAQLNEARAKAKAAKSAGTPEAGEPVSASVGETVAQ